MKKETYKIQLTYSCNQKWADLIRQNERRHCVTCNKHVTDISAKSDQEIIQLLQSGGNCVRLSKSQLEKEYQFAPSQKPTFPMAKTFALVSVSLLALNAAANSDITLQPNQQTAQHTPLLNLSSKHLLHKIQPSFKLQARW